MTERLRLLAVDLGAESGRVVAGAFDGSRLEVEEVHRFPNVPVRMGGTLHWDFLRIFGDVLGGIRKAATEAPLASIGMDAWGVDFGLVDRSGRLVGPPVHYRDRRTEGVMEAALRRVPRHDIYEATGIQFMQINTLYQLISLVQADDPVLERADRMLLIPDLVNHFLGGSTVAEATNASTTQCYDPRAGEWATGILERFDVPTRILPEIVGPGTVLGPLLPDVAADVGLPASTRLVAPGTHDTASAVAAIPLSRERTTAYLSSGTWSLVGLELDAPLIDDAALDANLTNEGGVAGTTRLLKNVTGLWLLQEARRALAHGAEPPSYEGLIAAAEGATPFSAFIDPNDERFLRPTDLPEAVRAACRETGQAVPEDSGTLARVLLESLALKYAQVIGELEAVSGSRVEAIHIVGGGTHNELLCRLTSGAAGRPVMAGPSEATAIGNLIVQAIATGLLGSLGEARDLVAASFPPRRYDPEGDWSEPRERFQSITRVPQEVAT